MRGGVTKGQINGTHGREAIGGDKGVHSRSEQIGSAHTPACIDSVRMQDGKECESRKECW